MLGIIGAMEEEVEKLKEQMTEVRVQAKASMEFYRGKLKGREVVVVRSGIGKVNAAICTQILADDYQVDGIINTGIAGSLRAEINIGDIVISTDAVQHDMDAVAFGYKPGQIPRMDTWSFPADQKRLRKPAAGRHCRSLVSLPAELPVVMSLWRSGSGRIRSQKAFRHAAVRWRVLQSLRLHI